MASSRMGRRFFTFALCVVLVGTRLIQATDCNGNGVEDARDLRPQNFGFLSTPFYAPGLEVAADLNGDGKPDFATATNGASILINKGDGTFMDAAPYHAGSDPNSLIAADLNGDGKPDLATANSNDVMGRDVSVLINRGDGTFEPPVNYPIGSQPYGPIAADLDGDGKLDLAVTNDAEVFVLINQGDGTFKNAVRVSYRDGAEGGYRPLMTADFNGDGRPDLATTVIYDAVDHVAVLINRGDGTFEAAVNYPVAGGGGPFRSFALTAADLDGDGMPDLAMTTRNDIMGPREITVLLNRGDGTFRDGVSYPVGGENSLYLVAADLDGDGSLDIAVVDTNSFLILLNRGDGTFKDAVKYSGGFFPNVARLGIGDFNGDGKFDLVAADDASVFILPNHGDGTFADAVGYAAESGRSSLVVADLNGDGKQDIATAHSVLLNRGDGTFEGAVIYPAYFPYFLTEADIDGDRKPDIVVAGGGQVSILLNEGDRRFKAPRSFAVTGSGLCPLIFADFNGDDKPDIATATGDPLSISVLLNQGGGAFQNAVSYPIGSNPRILITAADLNGDGRPDLAVRYRRCFEFCPPQIPSFRDVSILLNNGDGTFLDAVNYPLGEGPLIVADLNGDGKPELITAKSGCPSCDPAIPGELSVLFNLGDGTFKEARSYPLDVEAASVIVADLNGDGRSDLATVSAGCYSCDPPIPGDVSVFLNQGDGTFKDAVSYPVGLFFQGLIAVDLNADGKLDLATTSDSEVAVLVNRRDGTFKAAERYAVGVGGTPDPPLIAADLNGDGKPDLATVNDGSGGIAVLLNRGDGTFEEAVALHAGVPVNTRFLATDLDGDGLRELVVLSQDGVKVFWNHTVRPVSLDANGNSIPDECEHGPFHRGDPNSSGSNDISDGIAIFGFLFLGNPATLGCKESADANNDGAIDISDGIYLLQWLFTGGPEPVAPGPTGAPCGFDPDPPGSPGDLGCESYICK